MRETLTTPETLEERFSRERCIANLLIQHWITEHDAHADVLRTNAGGYPGPIIVLADRRAMAKYFRGHKLRPKDLTGGTWQLKVESDGITFEVLYSVSPQAEVEVTL